MTKIVNAPFGCNVYVASLPMDFSDQQLFELFAPYGSINSARIMRAKGTRVSKGYGFVLYKNPKSAAFAIANAQGIVINGVRLQVRIAHPDASTSLRKFPQVSNSTSFSSTDDEFSNQLTPTPSTITMSAPSSQISGPVVLQAAPYTPMCAAAAVTAAPHIMGPVPMYSMPNAATNPTSVALQTNVQYIQPIQASSQPMCIMVFPDGQGGVRYGF